MLPSLARFAANLHRDPLRSIGAGGERETIEARNPPNRYDERHVLIAAHSTAELIPDRESLGALYGFARNLDDDDGSCSLVAAPSRNRLLGLCVLVSSPADGASASVGDTA